MKKTYLGMLLLLMAMILASCSTDRTGTIYQTHPTGWADKTNPNFHGRDRVCGECHSPRCYGIQWDTNVSNIGIDACRSCHGDRSPTLACIQCHGTPPTNNGGLPHGFNNGAYGAHAKHARFACTECHLNPGADGHSCEGESAQVGMTFGNIANHLPFSNPTYIHAGGVGSGNGTCSATYCHSDGHGGGPMRRIALPWVEGQITCGDCHTIPPTTAWHPQPANGLVPACSECHGNVDPTSDFHQASLNIRFFDETLHVNGRVDR